MSEWRTSKIEEIFIYITRILFGLCLFSHRPHIAQNTNTEHNPNVPHLIVVLLLCKQPSKHISKYFNRVHTEFHSLRPNACACGKIELQFCGTHFTRGRVADIDFLFLISATSIRSYPHQSYPNYACRLNGGKTRNKNGHSKSITRGHGHSQHLLLTIRTTTNANAPSKFEKNK